MEIILQRIANRPFAGALRQLRQRQAAGNRRNDVSGRSVIENFSGLDVDLLMESRCHVRAVQSPCRCRADASREIRCARGRGGGALGRGARRRDRAASLDASRQVEAMHLAYHGVAADAAQLCCYLAGAQSFGPQFLEFLDPLVCPVHAASPLVAYISTESLSVSRDMPRAWFPPDFR
ncbi:hypothetical protein D3C80_1494070 [compost metagenome]